MPEELTLSELLAQVFNKDQVIDRLTKNPGEVAEAIACMYGHEQPQGWRAAWVLKFVLTKNDERIGYTGVNRILQALGNRPDGHQRELIHVLDKFDMDDDQEGLFFEQCLIIWRSVSKTPSVRHMAFRQLAKVIKKYPELYSEIAYYVDDEYLSTLSPGIKSSIKRLIREIHQEPH
jgi:hypothetical protein